MKKSFLIFTLASYILISCNLRGKETGNKTESLLERYINDTTDFYEISVKYPVLPADKNGDIEKYVKNVVSELKEDWKVGGEIYNIEKEISREFPDRASIKYSLNIDYKAYTSVKDNMSSCALYKYEYTGGANGNESVITFTFNDRGDTLDITDILDLNNNNDIRISRLIAEKALNDRVKYDETMLMQGLGLSFLKDDGVTIDYSKCNCDGFTFRSNLRNFVLTNDGIIFLFNKYQIAAGFIGIPEIKLTWEELKPYLIINL